VLPAMIPTKLRKLEPHLIVFRIPEHITLHKQQRTSPSQIWTLRFTISLWPTTEDKTSNFPQAHMRVLASRPTIYPITPILCHSNGYESRVLAVMESNDR
jgi:hypothetical protein